MGKGIRWRGRKMARIALAIRNKTENAAVVAALRSSRHQLEGHVGWSCRDSRVVQQMSSARKRPTLRLSEL
jgi:hypothetical protein